MGTAPRGDELLALLRRPDLERAEVDPTLAVQARLVLENAVEPHLPFEAPLRVTKEVVRRVLRCETHLLAQLGSDSGYFATAAMVKGAMADRLFTQVVAGFRIGDDVVAAALESADAVGDARLRRDWGRLALQEQDEVRTGLESIAVGLLERWPDLPSGALPRVQEALRVELCGGAVVLAGRLDLLLGRPRSGRVGTIMLDAKAGSIRTDDRDDVLWYCLLETLRSGLPPFQIGNYYLSSGALDLQPVTTEDLDRATGRVADALARLSRLAAGGEAQRSPGPLCPWCPVYASCEEGQAHVHGADDSTAAWLSFDEEWNEEDVFDAD